MAHTDDKPDRDEPNGVPLPVNPVDDHTVSSRSDPPSNVSVSSSPFVIPHPKRFNTVNINKKFLQKNSSSSATASVAASLAAAAAAKSGSPAPRPPPQPSASHSKLVTAKLTSTAQLSTTAGPGWSRPSSATPPVSATPAASSIALPPQPPAPAPVPHPFPHVGKVIQPQPRSAMPSSSPLVKKDTPAKSAWGIPKSLHASTDSAPSSDFPTAAEVAQGRLLKPEEPKPDDSLSPRRAAPQEADAFRGVHLDPNAHHWDEMEEDDDNFFGNIIEFGDGRQYKVAPPATGQPPVASTATSPVGEESSTDHVSAEPVSKEERFADDFDRSWPRARQSPLVLQRDLPSRSSQHISVSPTPSQPSHSSAEGSRVLFNERSNRLEPYTTPCFPNRVAPNHGFSRRNTQAEPALSPSETRFSRDALPHSPSSRSYTGDFSGKRPADRDGGSYTSGTDYGQNKARSKDSGPPYGSFHDTRSIGEKRHRRLSAASFASSIPDAQQGSSHSSDIPFSRRSQPRDSPLQYLSALPANATAQSSKAPQLPASSDAQLSGTSSVLDIEGVHKTAMHISAERARQRRQLEEEEREKEKERARKKAAELEARMKEAQGAATVETIHQAVTSAQDPSQSTTDPKEYESPELTQHNAIERPPSLRPVARPQSEIQGPRSGTVVNESLPPSEQVDSWRSKTRLQPQQLPALSVSLFQDSSSITADDNLEVVDFSDLGKFVGDEQVSLASTTPAPSSHSPASSDRRSFPLRPIASDFFEDDPASVFAPKLTSPSFERNTLPIVPEASAYPSSELAQSFVSTAPIQGTRENDPQAFSGPNGVHSFSRSQPSPTTQHHRLSKGPAPFRQVRMSALDDVMSRIKGALDDMQVDAGRGASSNESVDWRTSIAKSKGRVPEPLVPSRNISKDAKWLPPALRQSRQDQDVFGPTGCEPPSSPPPVTLVVKLPTVSLPVDSIPRRQLHLLKNSSSHVRFDTLSWDPPVDGMSKRDLSVNEILFRRPPLGKGNNKPRYRVQLPRATRMHAAYLPKVNLPSGLPKTNTLPGRSKAVDDLLTWRRGPTSSTTDRKAVPSEETAPILDVTSCSPAPETAALPSKPTVAQEISSKSETYLVRQRTQPKLPEGKAVGFYRDPGPSFQDAKATVNFTVISELEEGVQVSQPESSMLLSSSIAETSTATVPSGPKGAAAISSPIDEASRDVQPPTLNLITQVESKVSEESERSLRTPASASFNTPWTKSPLSFSSKDSPARPPDPEHLRAVWSQTADKEPISAVNSLEGIADDLTALPFTIQEVKSEDGETPPPTSAAVASKISIHDVTRAFQQVPTSSNLSSHRPPPLSPTAVNGPTSRPQTFTFPTGAGVRPHFAAFSSPMLAHSPSPTMLYPPSAPSPIPRVPMNGHPQLYNQPMWVPMQASQNNGGVGPVHSPYPTQMVAYPAPTPVHPVYAPGLSPQNVPPSVANSARPRPRGMPMLSPVMHPAAPANVPMYNGSPVLMHPPAMMTPGHRPPFMNSGPPERGQARSENMAVPHMQQPSHSQNHIPPHPMYTHVPFSRPSW